MIDLMINGQVCIRVLHRSRLHALTLCDAHCCSLVEYDSLGLRQICNPFYFKRIKVSDELSNIEVRMTESDDVHDTPGACKKLDDWSTISTLYST